MSESTASLSSPSSSCDQHKQRKPLLLTEANNNDNNYHYQKFGSSSANDDDERQIYLSASLKLSCNNKNNNHHDEQTAKNVEQDNEDDWQIIDEDCELGDNNQTNPNSPSSNPTAQSSKILKMSSDYVEIDPTLELRNNARFVTKSYIFICAAIYSLMPLASLLATITLVALLFTRYYLITLLYYSYVFWDRKTCNSGGGRVDAVYKSKFWTYLAAYFPIRLRHPKDFKLDPNKNYILSYHPHGISAFGSVTLFATNGLHFAALFPKITPRFMVHETSFLVPVMRETFTFRGDCSVNAKSIDHFLASSESKGNLLTIVVGGLAEADLSDGEILKIVVAQRKGFVKKALTHGTNIIPCIAMGENSVFTKVNFKPTSLMHRLESRFYQLFKFKHPIYYGRSWLSDRLKGSVPYKRPITVCMAKPIEVSRVESPSQDDVDMLHAKYMSKLRILYEDNKDLCTKYDRQMLLV